MSIGDRIRPLDWDARTTGRAVYTTDVQQEGMVHARVLRSPYPHARIRSVDVSRARRAAGVVAVVSASDVPDEMYLHLGGPFSDRRVFAKDVVRFIGEEVAAVAAETPEQAAAALALIRVRYRRLRSATDVGQALARRAPSVHADRPGNLSMDFERTYGDPSARAASAVTASGSYRYPRATHLCMEPHSVVARWDDNAQRMDLWVSSQAPYFVRKEVAHVLGLEPDQVHTHDVAVGGGFGAKSKVGQHEAIAAALSMRCGRPVRLVLDRDEEFATTHTRHAVDVRLTTGATREGTLVHRDADITVENGAYNHNGPSIPVYAAMLTASLHRVQSAQIHARLVDTHTQAASSFRGFGNPQINFAMESQLDELADRLQIDPLELRVKNAHRSGDTTLTGWKLTSAPMVECLEAVREAIGWDEKRAAGGRGRGVGVACAIHPSGARAYDGSEFSGAGVDVTTQGRVHVRFAGADAGTGQATLLAQIAAAELGIDLAAVDVTMMRDEGTPPDLGAWSSRGTMWSGHAVANTARAAADRLREAAAEKLGLAPSEISLSGGQAHGGGESIDLGDVALLAGADSDGVLHTDGGYLTDVDKMDKVTGISNFSPAYSFIAQAVEVEVDQDTGQVRVLQVVSALDCGVAINPLAVEGQVIGSVAMGLGAALGEEMIHVGGRLANGSYVDYHSLRPSDLPPIRTILVARPDPGGPYGAKGMGEIALVPTPAAVANAVAHACGVRVRDLPITPDKLLPQLRSPVTRPSVWRRPGRWWVEVVRRAYPLGLLEVLDRWSTRARPPEPVPAIERLEQPASTTAAVAAASSASSEYLAGGTDLLVRRRQGLARPTRLVDLAGLADLVGIGHEPGDTRIGAGVTLRALEEHARASGWDAFTECLAGLATPQIREMATLGGNLLQANRCWFLRNGFDCYQRRGITAPCYAVLGDHRSYHAVLGAHRCQAVTPSDLATLLGALDARVLVLGAGGVRDLPIGELYQGPGESTLARGELMTAVVLPDASLARSTAYEKLSMYAGGFAVASVALSVRLDGTRVRDVRVVLGGVAPTPYRARRVEDALRGIELGDAAVVAAAAETWAVDAHPLANNAWKIDAASGLIRRAARRLADGV